MASKASIYQLKVSLLGIKPPIWRRFQVRSDVSLAYLHEVLQVVMGWENYHLYQFEIGGEYFGEPSPEYMDEMLDASKMKLAAVFPAEGAGIRYQYDFGDSWDHEIKLEKILPPEKGKDYPVCLKGKRACPPEDCGGVWGYSDLLEILRNPEREDPEELREWAGEDFDPEEFDPESVNRRFKQIK